VNLFYHPPLHPLPSREGRFSDTPRLLRGGSFLSYNESTMNLLKKVRETIKKYSMLSEGDRVLIGLSGGADSVCLTNILDELKEDFNLSLNAVYVDHGLRPAEVKAETAFCKQLCERLEIGFLSKSVDVTRYAKEKKLGVQEAARKLRYQVFGGLSIEIKATKIALGHTIDDQAETVLMHLLRGAGYRGLSGIPPVRRQEVSSQQSAVRSLTIIRPLIEIERNEIEEFLTHPSPLVSRPSPPFMVDSSNLKKDYFRNWIRLMVIPELKKRNPALIRNICKTADILREEDAYMEVIVTKALMRLISRKSDDTIELFLSPLETMKKPILRRVLRRAISETVGINRGIDFIHIEDMIELIKKGKSGDRIYLPKGIKAIKSYSTFILTSKIPKELKTRMLIPPGEVLLEEVSVMLVAEISESLERKDILSSLEKLYDGRDGAAFDFDSLSFPLIIRRRQKGDYFYPSGFGKRKKLQDFFVDNKIPKDERDTIPIVVSGDDIIWIVGHRMDERFRAKEGTKRFLIMRSLRGR
jgi:tRNA(Ile)-lysidine synthase